MKRDIADIKIKNADSTNTSNSTVNNMKKYYIFM